MNKAIVDVPLPDRGYRIHITGGGLVQVGRELAAASRATRATVISDEIVAPLYAERLGQSLLDAGIEYTLLTIPAGETSKSLDMAGQLYDELAAGRHARHETVIALGGGVVGDLAGFVAATWHRGVPFVQCPTTLEAMIDAAVGGKTGLNHPTGKNLIGAFHQPLFVMADSACLATLSQRDFIAALAESVKHAVIAGEPMLEWHERQARLIHEREAACMTELIRRNCEIKAGVVVADEREQAATSIGRAALNFGHTIGHAIEAEVGYALRHGEAVALGMIAEMELAVESGKFSEAARRRVEALLALLALPRTAPLPRPERVMDRLFSDKKTRADRLRFAVPTALGRIEWLENPRPESVRRAIERVAKSE